MVILWRLVLLENELRAQFCIDFGCCLFWAFSLFLIIQTFKVRFLLSPNFRLWTLFQSKSAWLSNTAWAKEGGYERFTFCQHCKKTGRKYQWSHFLTKRMGCTWQSSRFLQNDAFVGDQGPSMQARLIFRKDRNQTSGQNIPPYKMRGCCKELVDAQSPFVWRNVYLHPFIL